ncbi:MULTISPECIES: xanthine dehydrogenase family protein molybdopterin-binding subunit [unclassified Nocardioides]|uniref:xanthine dehydrogenase family protein molybdopterin-binding subunit n=1 Tax=unclassified Nocardioides TaxID=2615069 RepID=UPI0000570BBF|nr:MULTISPECIES: xanthine dehydrogenase family protein molybdopterin-binding subunit [unclassified Nocardioides]ABL83768.1 xanthine dehydrogenase, molybdenum binding subunit apoprotein [Nocardioides sp. JS614]
MSDQLRTVGTDVPRVETVEKLTGDALYTGDLLLPGMLHAKVKHSPHARARILRVDTARAEALPGVHAVLTGHELDYKIGLYVVDKDILAKDVVRHFGEAVAAVAAETPEIASAAVDLIEVEYDVLTPVLDPMEAIRDGAPLVHPDLGSYAYVEAAFSPQPGTNVAHVQKVRKGDLDRGFAEAEWVVEREYTNPSVQHVPLETHVAVVQWKAGDQVTIWTSAQSPFTVRNLFCTAMRLPLNQVRVVVPHVGGGFGGKAGIHLEPLVACLSRKAGGRPVRLQATREEEFSLLPCRSALTYRIRTGVRSDGTITAQQMTMYWDAGAYADYAVNVTRASGYSAGGPYEIPNAAVDSYAIYTNKPYGTAYRGFGHVEFFWGLERHMELVAQAIGMDPLEFRRRNLLRPGSLTMTGERITEHTGDPRACLDAVAEAIDYGRLTPEEAAHERSTGRRIGKGVATLHKAPAMPSFTATAAVVKMNSDASVVVNIALMEIGQGCNTALAQIVAERLRFPVERVKVAVERDTDKDPYDWQTVASKGLILSGNACLLACDDLLRQAYEVAGQVLRANVADLDHDADRVFVKHRPEESVTFAELSVGYAFPNGNGIGGPLVGVGRYIAQGLTNLDKETGQGLPALDWTYGAHGVVVDVDPETGEFDVLAISSAYDVGRVVNPGLVRGQAIGGMVQGLGTALCEGYIYDQQGRLLNPSFTDNKIPTARDIPARIDSAVVETAQLDGPFGARGVGEHPMISVAPAIGNAIQHATGAELLHMPMRFEDVWRALQRHEPIDNWITETPVGSCRSDLPGTNGTAHPAVPVADTGPTHTPEVALP